MSDVNKNSRRIELEPANNRASSDLLTALGVYGTPADNAFRNGYEMTKNARLAFGERGKMHQVPEGGDDLGAVPPGPKGQGTNQRPKAQATPAVGGGAHPA